MTDAQPGSPSVAIVIPSYGRPDLLTRTLDSIVEATWPTGFGALRVVENGPRGEIETVVSQYADQIPLQYLNEPKLGLSAARNAGFAHCDEDIIIFFDNDVRVERDALLAYRRAFDEHGTACFYGGAVLADYVTAPHEWLLSSLPPSAKGFDLGEEDCVLDGPWLIGPSMAFPRGLLYPAGGFDPIGATGPSGGLGEETRLQLRLMEAGYTGRYVAGARVWHYVPPENCSPEWALKRAYRRGLTDGQLTYGRGIERWMVRRSAELLMQLGWARLRGRSLADRFWLEREWARFRGVMAGCRPSRPTNET